MWTGKKTKALFGANRASIYIKQRLCFIQSEPLFFCMIAARPQLSDVCANFFQIACVNRIETIQCITVYIQYSDYFSLPYHRHYDFRF